MPILRLIAEGVGPFEKLDIDFSDGNGKPHLGPHILAGVNGSGKSTVLKTIAWVLDGGRRGFHYDDWQEALKGHADSRALMTMRDPDSTPRNYAVTKDEDIRSLHEWANRSANPDFNGKLGSIDAVPWGGVKALGWLSVSLPEPVGAYSPSKALRHLASPDLTKRLEDADQNSLAFESTAQNDIIQSWLLGLYSKRAIAYQRNESSSDYTRSLDRLDGALRLLYGEKVTFDVDIEPAFLQPRLNVRGQRLNFSQLPDGMRSTVAWVSDFMMRQDMFAFVPELKGKRPGILLLDEPDTHLHPLWQRTLLPAICEALPDVQIIVTSHSPFVISSCEHARLHVLKVDEQGHAHAEAPVCSPFGESVTATLKDIFDVDSRFDVKTEADLDDWDKLKRNEAKGSITQEEKQRLVKLTQTLSDRSEELRSIVASPRIPDDVIAAMLAVRSKNGKGKRGKSVPR